MITFSFYTSKWINLTQVSSKVFSLEENFYDNSLIYLSQSFLISSKPMISYSPSCSFCIVSLSFVCSSLFRSSYIDISYLWLPNACSKWNFSFFRISMDDFKISTYINSSDTCFSCPLNFECISSSSLCCLEIFSMLAASW